MYSVLGQRGLVLYTARPSLRSAHIVLRCGPPCFPQQTPHHESMIAKDGAFFCLWLALRRPAHDHTHWTEALPVKSKPVCSSKSLCYCSLRVESGMGFAPPSSFCWWSRARMKKKSRGQHLAQKTTRGAGTNHEILLSRRLYREARRALQFTCVPKS